MQFIYFSAFALRSLIPTNVRLGFGSTHSHDKGLTSRVGIDYFRRWFIGTVPSFLPPNAMSATDQLLPTISTLVALGELAFDGQLDSYGSDYANDCSINQLPDNQLTGNHFVEGTRGKTVRDALSAEAKQQRAEREWQGAVAALNQFLVQHIRQQQSAPKEGSFKSSCKSGGKSSSSSSQALVLCGPVPLLSEPDLIAQVSNWIFVPHSADSLVSPFSALEPVGRLFHSTFKKASPSTRLLPLLEDDPLLQERFALVFTAQFALVIVLGKDADDELRFQFSFMPEVVTSVWRLLRSRIRLTRRHQLDFIEHWVEKFAPQEPSYRTVSKFNRWLLASLPQPPLPSVSAARRLSKAHSAQPSSSVTQSAGESIHKSEKASADRSADASYNHSNHDHSHHDHSHHDHSTGQFSDSDLLKAMAHEIRTPLTTIRTYTRSLLKRKNLDAQVIQRLQSIDRECTQQIDRFSLIFRAVELEAASQMIQSPLSAIALHQVFQEAIPQWQQAAQRRNLSLEVGLPPELPMVASDPTMLQHVLTGLVELFTHSVSPGSHIQLHVLHAGVQLKLQFQSSAQPQTQSQSSHQSPNQSPNQSADQSASPSTSQSASQLRNNNAFPGNTVCSPPPLKPLGHLLMFQPETGGLSLNLEATKNLFHALGAKLIVRERSNQGTTWTVFLPLEASGLKSYPIV